MNIILLLIVVFLTLGVLWLSVQCFPGDAGNTSELQSRIDRLREENQALLRDKLNLRNEVFELGMALAECVKALREIEIIRPSDFSADHIRTASAALDRIQIPNDQLPTRCYPDEADDG